MAIIISSQYPGKTAVPDANYPQGSAQDVSSPSAGDGTPWQKDWVNDKEGFFQKLLDDAGITPSGSPDTVVSSDYVDSLNVIAGRSIIKLVSLSGYAVLDKDQVQTILVETGPSDRIITLPNVVNNPARKILIKKVDNDVGKVLVRTQSAGETIDGVDGTVGYELPYAFDSIEVVEGDSVYHIRSRYFNDADTYFTYYDVGAIAAAGIYSDQGNVANDPFGVQFAPIVTGGGSGEFTTYRIALPSDHRNTDVYLLEICRGDTDTWSTMAGPSLNPFQKEGNRMYGIGIRMEVGFVEVFFGNGGRTVGSTYGALGSLWSNIAGNTTWKWRVRRRRARR